MKKVIKNTLIGLSTLFMTSPVVFLPGVLNSYLNVENIRKNMLSNLKDESKFNNISNDYFYSREILDNIKNKKFINVSQNAVVGHFEQSFHKTPNNVSKGPIGKISFSYNPYIIDNKKSKDVNELLLNLNNSQGETLNYNIQGYNLSVDREYVGNVVLVPMYANGINFDRSSVSFQDKPIVVLNSKNKQEFYKNISDTKIGFSISKKYKSNDLLFRGSKITPFENTQITTSCGGPLCSHNIIDWVQLVCGGALGITIGALTGGVGALAGIGAATSVLIPSIVGGITGGTSGIINSVGGLKGNGSGKCSTLSSTINIFNDLNVISTNQINELGIINSYDFSKLFEFKNVLDFERNPGQVWTDQNLRLGFSDDIINAIKYLSEYKDIYLYIKNNLDNLLVATNGKYNLLHNNMQQIILGRKLKPELIKSTLEKIISYSNDESKFSKIEQFIKRAVSNNELEIFVKYKNNGAIIPNNIEEWDYEYKTVLPEYLTNDILCDIQYNNSDLKTIKLWDSKTGFQKINFESNEYTNISKIKLSNIRFTNLEKDTYSGLSLEKYISKKNNIILENNDSFTYYLSYRNSAKNIDFININENDNYIELSFDKYLISNANPLNGIINPITRKINDMDYIKNIVFKNIVGGNAVNEKYNLFSNVYDIEYGINFINWEDAKDHFRINGNNINNDAGIPTDEDVCYIPKNYNGYFYTILELKNFNFNDNLNYVDGDFTTNIKNKILGLSSLYPLNEAIKSTNQYFLARLKTNKLPMIYDTKLINSNDIHSFYNDESNWVDTNLIAHKKAKIWDGSKKFKLKFDPIQIESSDYQEALSLLEKSKYNSLPDNMLVLKERIGYELDKNDNIDYSRPIYEYKLNDNFNLEYNKNNNTFILLSKTLSNSIDQKLEFNVSITNFVNFFEKNNDIPKIETIKIIGDNEINFVKPDISVRENKWIPLSGYIIGILFLMSPLLIYWIIKNKKMIKNKKIEEDNAK